MGCGCSARPASLPAPRKPLSSAESAALKELFGDKLNSKSGDVSIDEAFGGKAAVAIYFSAHWCPPCRGFTPKLAQAYTSVLRSKGLEIVFASSDQTEDEFKGYYKTMPWLALPYESRSLKEKLSKKFKVQGIPSLVILDMEGNVITKDGRSKVMDDPKGQSFPWKAKPFAEIIGNIFLKGNSTIGKEAIAGKTLGIYFSAHWCPPCRGFTPELAKHYKAYKEKGLPFEVIFCTGDRDEASFKSYFAEMAEAGGDWLAIPWKDYARRNDLNTLFEVSGIPALVIIDEHGHVINKNGRRAISNDPIGDEYPWAPPAVGNLSRCEGIDEAPAICVFMESATAEEQKKMLAALDTVAKKVLGDAKSKNEDPKFLFYAARSDEGPVQKIRSMCGLPKDAQQPAMLLLDLADNGAYYTSDASEISITSLEDFMRSYEAKSLKRNQMAG